MVEKESDFEGSNLKVKKKRRVKHHEFEKDLHTTSESDDIICQPYVYRAVLVIVTWKLISLGSCTVRGLVRERLRLAQKIADNQTGTKATDAPVHSFFCLLMSASGAALSASDATAGATSSTEALGGGEPRRRDWTTCAAREGGDEHPASSLALALTGLLNHWVIIRGLRRKRYHVAPFSYSL